MLCHDNLKNHYKMNFILNQDFGMSLTELDNMLPYEREIYIYMIIARMKEREKQQQNG